MVFSRNGLLPSRGYQHGRNVMRLIELALVVQLGGERHGLPFVAVCDVLHSVVRILPVLSQSDNDIFTVKVPPLWLVSGIAIAVELVVCCSVVNGILRIER